MYNKSAAQAKESIDSISKKLYEMLFKHIVEKINKSIGSDSIQNDNDLNL